MTSNEIARFADVAMYDAEPDRLAERGFAVEPQVTLVSMTQNPLRVMTCAASLYSGKVNRSPEAISRNDALFMLDEMTRTAIKAPLEFIDLHFLFEGVTRAFTHQLVRQRTAVYVQESLRFAVKGNAEWEVAMPPSIQDLKPGDPKREEWARAVRHATGMYNALISAGVPAEDARGLLPTNITTRVHYKTNLRNLVEHSGIRLCSQAQFEWKQVWLGIIQAIRYYGPDEERWQQQAITQLFKPICYRTGRCEFMASTDRACLIRDRVEAHHAKGEPPETWVDINPYEPVSEGAARMRPGA